MVRISLVLFFVIIIGSISFAIYMYTEYQPNFVQVNAGEPVQIGPVEYIIQYEGTHEGDKDTRPEHVFVKISMLVKNLGDEETRINGGQFFILDENDKKVQPIFGGFTPEELLNYQLQPDESVLFTTQFDIPFDEEKQYRIGIVPTKDQASIDIGMVCILNC